MSSGICFEWRDRGVCSRGANCQFTHVGAGGTGSGGPGRGRAGICYQFQNSGTCRFGSNCRFRHVGGGGGPASRSGRGAHSLSRSARLGQHGSAPGNAMMKFIKHVSVVKREKLGEELARNADLWRRCWQNQDMLDDNSRRSMLEVLAKTPGSSMVGPPPIHSLQQVANKFLAKEAQSGVTSDDHVLTAVKTVKDVLSRLLQFEWDCPREQVVDVLGRIVLEAESKLRKQKKDHRDVGLELMGVLEDMEIPWRIQTKDDGSSGIVANEQEVVLSVDYNDWKTPTVGWLCTPGFFAPGSCPKMKTGQAGVYDSAED